MTTPLAEQADSSGVENVVIFVSDALRFDFLPEEVRALGVAARAIAPSTFTASALPSLLTGRYPASHRVWMFDDRLPARPALLDPDETDVGFDAEGVWIKLPSAQKPPLQIHHVETESKLEELSPPFTHVVHDVGPHAPYGFENGVFESTREFFETHEDRRPQLVELYRRDCRNSAERFLAVYDQIVERDLLDRTLLVFTSDHGQCLGEPENGGRFGHGHPMCPETVEIPIVFMGAGLPRGETYGALLSGTDVAPTALSAQRGRIPSTVDGVDVWRNAPDPNRLHRSDVWQHLDAGVGDLTAEISVYAATSAWNQTGGYVFQRASRLERFAAIAYDNLFRGYAPAWLANASVENAVNLTRLSLANTRTFGDPDFSERVAGRSVPDAFEKETDRETEADLSEAQEAQLRDLGYLS